MTKEGFRRYITPYIEAGKPFSAYWYTRGFGLILTGPVNFGTSDKPKFKTLTSGKLKRWHKNIDLLRRNGFGELVTVDFDGKNTMIEGGFEL